VSSIDVNRQRGLAVYLQIQTQIERRIAAGSLAPGDPLPSVRTLAKELRINPNTVVRAYRELEHLGLVETRHGEGTFVAEGAARLARASALVEGHAAEYVRAAKELGLTQTEAVAAVKAAWRKDESAKVA
jgi:GntR family transcriptional regulator